MIANAPGWITNKLRYRNINEFVFTNPKCCKY